MDVLTLVAATTGVAVHLDGAGLVDNDVGLGVAAGRAQNELLDKAVQQLLQLGGIVGAVDNVAVGLLVALDLGAELTSKVLGGV